MKRLMERSRKKIKLKGKGNLIPEKVRKIPGEKEMSSYRILQPFALKNTKCNRHECNTLHIILQKLFKNQHFSHYKLQKP